jgi:hypothetical protein
MADLFKHLSLPLFQNVRVTEIAIAGNSLGFKLKDG